MAKRKTSATELLAQAAENPEAITRLVNMFFEEIRKRVKGRLSEEMAARVSRTEIANDVANDLAVALATGSPLLQNSTNLRGFLTVLVKFHVSNVVRHATRKKRNPNRNRVPLEDDSVVHTEDPADRLAQEEAILLLVPVVTEELNEIENDEERFFLILVITSGDSVASVHKQMPDDGSKPPLRTCQVWVQRFRKKVQARMKSKGWLTVDEP